MQVKTPQSSQLSCCEASSSPAWAPHLRGHHLPVGHVHPGVAVILLGLALQDHRVVVLQPPLPHVGHGQAPVAVAHVDGDYQLVELEDAPARGLDLFAPALHRPVAAPTAFIFWGGAFLLAQNLLTSSSESLSSFARVFAKPSRFRLLATLVSPNR